MKLLENIVHLVLFLLRCSRQIRYVNLWLAVVAASGVLAGISNAALVAVTNSALHRVGTPTPELVGKFVMLCLLLPLMRLGSQFILIRLTAKTVYNLRLQLCRQILSAPLSLLEKIGAHRLLAGLTDDVPAISAALANLPILSMNLTLVIGCLAYLGWLSTTMFIVVAVFITIGVLTYQLPVLRAIKYFQEAHQERDELFKHFSSLIEGIKELKLHRRRRETFLSQLLAPTMESLQRSSLAGMSVYMAATSWGQILSFALIGFILFLVPAFEQVDAKTLTGYTLITLYLVTPIEIVLNALPNLGRASVAVQSVDSLGMSLSGQIVETNLLIRSPRTPQFKVIELAGVTHIYQKNDGDDEFAVGPIDISFRPGELIFLVGGNGSGKTTLAKILTGLYTPTTGEIFLNGAPVTEKTRDSYRQLFSAVFSDFHLFDNLLGLDLPNLDARVRGYLEQLELDDKLDVKDGRLSTLALSRGQCKRLALLTAYLEDRPFYLFDEWAADQDPYFREIFYFKILPELKESGKTILVISHDDRYYRLADRILKLDYGKLESIQDLTPEERCASPDLLSRR
jgi:putative pyoverdin transport system ATP-binding/permease protein